MAQSDPKLEEAARLALKVARTQTARLLGVPLKTMALPDLLAHAWLCGAVAVLAAKPNVDQ